MATTEVIEPKAAPWHAGVTRYHWLVLLLACAGWVFDVYEGQIFNLTSPQMLADIVPNIDASQTRRFGDMALAAFLVGGALGGIASGVLADRYGRKPVLVWTIVVYSLFSGLTFLATAWWQVLVLRFLVAIGVGGAWSVAATMVAEVFPKRLRAYASSFFHATSILGGLLATVVAIAVAAQWRYAYLLGLLPAALALVMRSSLHEPPASEYSPAAAEETGTRGSLKELLCVAPWSGRAIGGLLLAAVGLGTFWGINVAGQDLAREFFVADGMQSADAMERSKFAFGIMQGIGGGLGLVFFGPLCTFLGRRRAFIVMQLAAYVLVPIMCYVPATTLHLYCLLPVFGFVTVGFHAGYAVYFPELFPQRLRATGTGFCFNGGRLVAAIVLVASSALKAHVDLHLALILLSQLFLCGAVCAWLMPETRGADLTQ
jgi:MFS family permease